MTDVWRKGGRKPVKDQRDTGRVDARILLHFSTMHVTESGSAKLAKSSFDHYTQTGCKYGCHDMSATKSFLVSANASAHMYPIFAARHLHLTSDFLDGWQTYAS